MKTGREQQEERRQAKLESVREQVESGSLVIREMTDEERLQYPPRPRDARRRHGQPVEAAVTEPAESAADELVDEPEPEAD